MAWYDAQNMGSAFPLLDYGTQTIARNVNNVLPNNRNNSGLQWWMNADRGRYPDQFPDNLTQDLGAATYRGPQISETVVDESRIPGRIQKELPTKKGFSFNPLNWGIMGMAKKIIEPNTPEENFGLKYFGDRNTLSSSGRTYGNQAYDVFAGKNVASAFGQGMGGAAQKRIDRINQTLSDWEAKAAEGDEEAIHRLKTTTLHRRKTEFEKQLAEYNKKLGAATGGADTTGGYITKTTPDGGGYTGPRTYDFDRGAFQRSGGQRASTSSGHTDPGKGSYGPWMAEGGRVGLRLGGDPEEPAENIFEFMQDQGINYDQMAEGVPQEFPSDALGAINVNEEQMAMISDLNDKGMDISLISTISGADEDTVTRIIRLLNAKAQGGSVGYFDGGIASLV